MESLRVTAQSLIVRPNWHEAGTSMSTCRAGMTTQWAMRATLLCVTACRQAWLRQSQRPLGNDDGFVKRLVQAASCPHPCSAMPVSAAVSGVPAVAAPVPARPWQ